MEKHGEQLEKFGRVFSMSGGGTLDLESTALSAKLSSAMLAAVNIVLEHWGYLADMWRGLSGQTCAPLSLPEESECSLSNELQSAANTFDLLDRLHDLAAKMVDGKSIGALELASLNPEFKNVSASVTDVMKQPPALKTIFTLCRRSSRRPSTPTCASTRTLRCCRISNPSPARPWQPSTLWAFPPPFGY